MLFNNLSTFLVFVGFALARPQVDAVKRDQVTACKNILVSLKATNFCSSLLDSTVVITSTDSPVTATVTSTLPPCIATITGPVTTIKTTTTKTIYTSLKGYKLKDRNAIVKTSSASPNATVMTSKAGNWTSPATTSSAHGPIVSNGTCSIKSLPPLLSVFGCDVLKKACQLVVKPKTITSSTTVAGSTITQIVPVDQGCFVTSTQSTQTKTVTVTTTAAASPSSKSNCPLPHVKSYTESGFRMQNNTIVKDFVSEHKVLISDSVTECRNGCSSWPGCEFFGLWPIPGSDLSECWLGSSAHNCEKASSGVTGYKLK